jgi:hypothetical protein
VPKRKLALQARYRRDFGQSGIAFLEIEGEPAPLFFINNREWTVRISRPIFPSRLSLCLLFSYCGRDCYLIVRNTIERREGYPKKSLPVFGRYCADAESLEGQPERNVPFHWEWASIIRLVHSYI